MNYYGIFHEVRPGTVIPKGQLKNDLEKQLNLSSHFQEQGYPFDTPMWNGGTGKVVTASVICHDPAAETPMQEAWWPYEQSAYLLDGILRLGILLGDEEKIELFRQNAEYAATHPDRNGLLGHAYCDASSEWPMAVFFRGVHAYCEAAQDESVKQAFIAHYSALTAERLCGEFRNINNLEGLLKCYEWSHDPQLLQKALKAYELHNLRYSPPSEDEFELPWNKLVSGRNFVIHGVSFSEAVKLPVLLYLYSGAKHYLEGAEKALADVLARHEQIPGLPSSNEDFAGRDPLQGYESCLLADFTWALGYFLMATGKVEYADRIEKIIFNAFPGSLSDDFCTLQYLSSPNQVIATDYSNHSFFYRGSANFRQFRSSHCAQCCTGNIHRVLPNFALRSWMTDGEGNPAAVFYAASEFHGTCCGKAYRIEEITEYPFDEKILFRFALEEPAEIAFSFRIPAWCETPEVTVNGCRISQELQKGTFVKLSRTWQNGDTVTVSLPMKTVQKKDRWWSHFERGPLVYTLAIPFSEHRESPSAYAPRNLLPEGKWNYAVSPGTRSVFTNGTLQLRGFPVTGFDMLEQGRYTPEVPLWGKRCGQDETLTLVPYGKAKLRITAFPDGVERKLLPVYQVLAGKPLPYDHFLPLSQQWTSPDELMKEEEEMQMDHSGFYDLLHHFGPMRNVLCGMRFRIWSDRAQEAFAAVGVSDGAECFINKEYCYSIEPPCDGEFMAPFVFKVKLKQGFNDLLLKVCEGPTLLQYRSAWGARVQIFTEELD